MIPPSFDYHAPNSVAEAIKLLGDLGPDAKLLAGGHSLLPMMKLRFAQPAHLIDLNRITALRGIREEGSTVCIGAMTVERDLIASKVLQARLPLLPEAARQIGDPQVRNRGTIGGDIAHGDPGNDHPAICIALEASFVLEGPNGKRQVKADGFFLGTYMTGMAGTRSWSRFACRPSRPRPAGPTRNSNARPATGPLRRRRWCCESMPAWSAMCASR